MSLLEVRGLRVSFGRRRIEAVRGIDFDLAEGQRLGLIGESGSGKTVTALAVMGLLPENAAGRRLDPAAGRRDHRRAGERAVPGCAATCCRWSSRNR